MRYAVPVTVWEYNAEREVTGEGGRRFTICTFG
jgi:hypothetical protein